VSNESFENRVAETIRALSPEFQERASHDIESLRRASLLSQRDIEVLVQDSTGDPMLRRIAAWVIGLIHDLSLADSLEKVVEEGQPISFLWEAAKTLSALGKGVTIFKRFLVESRDPEIRKLAAFALGQLRDPSGGELLMRVLRADDEEPSVRGQAAEALGYLGDRSALDVLLSAAKDPVPEVRFWSAFAMGQLGDERALPTLDKMALTDHVRVDGWWEISREAAEAIAEVRKAKDR